MIYAFVILEMYLLGLFNQSYQRPHAAGEHFCTMMLSLCKTDGVYSSYHPVALEICIKNEKSKKNLPQKIWKKSHVKGEKVHPRGPAPHLGAPSALQGAPSSSHGAPDLTHGGPPG